MNDLLQVTWWKAGTASFNTIWNDFRYPKVTVYINKQLEWFTHVGTFDVVPQSDMEISLSEIPITFAAKNICVNIELEILLCGGLRARDSENLCSPADGTANITESALLECRW